jgi:DNA-binding MarR family transcriptional regulator
MNEQRASLPQPPSLPRAVMQLLEYVSRSMHSASFTGGLNPAQWNALRYLSSANPTACTVTAFARHHMTKKSAASSTIKSLMQKGLIAKTVDPDDGRAQRLDLTQKARKLMESDPTNVVLEALETMTAADLVTTARVFEVVARAMYSSSASDNFED